MMLVGKKQTANKPLCLKEEKIPPYAQNMKHVEYFRSREDCCKGGAHDVQYRGHFVLGGGYLEMAIKFPIKHKIDLLAARLRFWISLLKKSRTPSAEKQKKTQTKWSRTPAEGAAMAQNQSPER